MSSNESTMADGNGRLAGKVAIVTGGARGIGEATVERALAEGARVALLDIDEVAGFSAATNLDPKGKDLLFVRCDITVERDVEAAMGRVVEHFGRLDVLINNAGVNAYFDATEMTEDQWERVFAVDLKGAWLCTKHALPQMLAAGAGSIVNIGSIHARQTIAGMFPYASAKSGIVGMTRSLALDYGPRGIRVNAVCPGWTRTHLVQEWFEKQPDPAEADRQVCEVHPLRRIASPDEIARFIVFIASDEASFVTGAELYIDGGLSALFPT
jgi:NAD(P)-dependent dehydrogenase (short-subunit alcohol dehydrogenase family)